MLEHAFREVREELELFAAWQSVEVESYCHNVVARHCHG